MGRAQFESRPRHRLSWDISCFSSVLPGQYPDYGTVASFHIPSNLSFMYDPITRRHIFLTQTSRLNSQSKKTQIDVKFPCIWVTSAGYVTFMWAVIHSPSYNGDGSQRVASGVKCRLHLSQDGSTEWQREPALQCPPLPKQVHSVHLDSSTT
jgi:hypothetical protein